MDTKQFKISEKAVAPQLSKQFYWEISKLFSTLAARGEHGSDVGQKPAARGAGAEADEASEGERFVYQTQLQEFTLGICQQLRKSFD